MHTKTAWCALWNRSEIQLESSKTIIIYRCEHEPFWFTSFQRVSISKTLRAWVTCSLKSAGSLDVPRQKMDSSNPHGFQAQGGPQLTFKLTSPKIMVRLDNGMIFQFWRGWYIYIYIIYIWKELKRSQICQLHVSKKYPLAAIGHVTFTTTIITTIFIVGIWATNRAIYSENFGEFGGPSLKSPSKNMSHLTAESS